MGENKFSEALEFFNKSIQSNPENSFALNNRGFTKIQLGGFEDILEDLEKSMSINATNPWVYRNLGIYYYTIKDYPKALECFNQSNELDNDVPLLNEYVSKTKAALKLT